jgi:hypothetical protein
MGEFRAAVEWFRDDRGRIDRRKLAGIIVSIIVVVGVVGVVESVLPVSVGWTLSSSSVSDGRVFE